MLWLERPTLTMKWYGLQHRYQAIRSRVGVVHQRVTKSLS